MKKILLSLILFLIPSFLLSALQGNLYFIPISLPLFWCIIHAYYSFSKSLVFSLLLNIAHCLVIVSFTTISPSRLILSMNILSLVYYLVKERFHTNSWHISSAAGAGSLFFLSSQWALDVFLRNFYVPEIFSWLGVSLATLICAPPIVYFLNEIDRRIQIEKVETLENLRI